ncbi:MAG: hypothetical protein HC821_04510 [Lewinella sp.]|nr:hypothetical protein [Lewinella sp.]
MRGEAAARTIAEAVEIDRNLLVNQNAVYTLEADSLLRLTPVQVRKFDRESVIVSGLPNGTQLLTSSVANAFDGMLVTKKGAASIAPTPTAASATE